MTVETLGFLAAHARAICVAVPPSFSAMVVNFLTFSILAFPSGVSNCLMVSW